MVRQFDIVIRRARLWGNGAGLAEIGIRDGRIAAFPERTTATPRRKSTRTAIWFRSPSSILTCIRQDVVKLYDITVDAAAAINFDGFALSTGAPANLVVLDQPDEVEALWFHAPPAHVISNGRSVDTAKMRAIVAAGTGPA
jgi:hypothetical protein